MITLQDLTRHLDELFPKMEDYCPNGMQVEGVSEIDKIATAVTADLETIEAAAKWGAKALIVHHGLFWNRDEVRIVRSMRKKVTRLIEHGISLFCYHLPLDVHEKLGNNWVAAHDLGVHEREPFECGVRGRIDPTPIEAWVKKVEGYYEHPAHVALGGREEVKKVAIISGGSHRYIEAAARAGVDCLITGSFDLPVWPFAHEEGIHFIAVGHSNSERVGPKALSEEIKKRFHMETLFIDTANPF